MDFIYSNHWENLYFFLNGIKDVLHPVSREIKSKQSFSLYPSTILIFCLIVADTDIQQMNE